MVHKLIDFKQLNSYLQTEKYSKTNFGVPRNKHKQSAPFAQSSKHQHSSIYKALTESILHHIMTAACNQCRSLLYPMAIFGTEANGIYPLWFISKFPENKVSNKSISL